MTDQVENVEAVETTTPATDQIDVALLQKALESARSEAAKYRNIKNQAVEDLAKLKDSKTAGDDYKELYQQEKTARESLESRLNAEAVATSLRSQLTEKGIGSQKAIEAALKLIDMSLIDNSADEVGLDAAVIKLQRDYTFLFEQKVPSNTPKMPAAKVGLDDINTKEIARADFFNKPPSQQAALMKSGYIVI